MRRRETPLDPAIAAELEALEAALAGDPSAEPELATLVRDVRMDAPAMSPAFRAQLDERVESGFGREPAPPRRALLRRRPLIPALGFAGCLLAALVAVVVATGGSNDDSNGAGSGVAATQLDQRSSGAGESAGGSGGSGADSAAPSTKSGSTAQAAPSPAAPPANGGRHVERSTRLELTTTDVQKTADGIVRATQAAGG
ncbi:MAG TPA: hypothetical protein VK510_07995, partial [Solirubrobacteraceae bacterium]|nr:hypothetical protein [Solirubrobacteraceae bacterium]